MGIDDRRQIKTIPALKELTKSWSLRCRRAVLHNELLYQIASVRTRRWTSANLMLVHRLRRWPNINPTFVKRLELAGCRHQAITLAAKVFSNAKGNRSVGTFFHYISKKNIAFFSNNAQHRRGPLELLSRKTCFVGLKKSVISDILSLVTDVTQNSERTL